MEQGDWQAEEKVETKESSSKKKKKTGFAAMNLKSEVYRGIITKGFKQPTSIQKKIIPYILEGRDVVGCSKTGSGKTAAFVIPMIDKLEKHSNIVGVRALIVSPTRELAIQTSLVVRQLAKYTDLTHSLLIGGHQFEGQFESLASNPDIIISTPGRLAQLISELKLGSLLSRVQMLIFDEADYLFEMGFQSQMKEILKTVNPQKQVILISATIPGELSVFSGANLKDYVYVKLDKENHLSEQMGLDFILVRPNEKLGALTMLLTTKLHRQQVIVFCSTKYHVELVGHYLTKVGIANVGIYGKMDQLARKEMIGTFRFGQCQVLVVTDLAARGIDIPMVNYVVHYDYPPKLKTFIHRSGRTARATQSGQVYSFIFPNEIYYIMDILLHIGRKLNNNVQENKENTFSKYGCIPLSILADYVDHFQKSIKDDPEMKRMFESSEKAFKKFMKSREAASRASLRAAKDHDFTVYHPDFLDKNEHIEHQDILAQIKNYKPTQSYLEIKNTRDKKSEDTQNVLRTIKGIKKQTSRGQQRKDYRQSQKKNQEGEEVIEEAGDQQGEGEDKLNEKEKEFILKKEEERKKKEVAKQKETQFIIEKQVITQKTKKHLMAEIKDKNYISMTPNTDQPRELEDKNKISSDDIHGYIFGQDNQEQLDNQKRNVWNKAQKRYVYASANELKNSKQRNDKQDRGDKGQVATRDYSRWKRQSKMGLQKVGEEENANLVNRAKSNFANKFTKMRLYNNNTEKGAEQTKNVKSELKNTGQIIKIKKKHRADKLKNMQKSKRSGILNRQKSASVGSTAKKIGSKINKNSKIQKRKK